MGISILRTPRCHRASTTALAMAAGAPTVADSPTPLAPMGWCGEGVHAGFGQVQVDLRAVQRLVSGGVVERTQHLFGGAAEVRFADHPAQVAAVVYFNTQAQFHLAQVFVERPAQVGEAGVVLGIEGEVVLLQVACHKCVRVTRCRVG